MYISATLNLTTTFLLLVFLITGLPARAQNTRVSGTVTDAKTKQPVPFASIQPVGGGTGSSTDEQGRFSVSAGGTVRQIKISCVGYRSVTESIVPGKIQVLDITLEQDKNLLKEVVVNADKKYSGKDTAAIDLIRKVIENKQKNRSGNADYSEFEKYEKLQFSVNNIPRQLTKLKLARKYKFFFDNRDTALYGRSLLPVYLEEKISDQYYRRNPLVTKDIVRAEKKIDYGPILNSEGVGTFMNWLYPEIDLYSNSIILFTNPFLSPIADSAPLFYRYHITDTINSGNARLVELSFQPRNTTDLLFSGILYVSLDGNYAVRKAYLTVNHKINLNWVKDLTVNQEFSSLSGFSYLSRSEFLVEFKAIRNQKDGLIGQRLVSYRNPVFNTARNDSFYKGADVVHSADAGLQSQDFWKNARHDSLPASASRLYRNVDSLKSMPSYKRLLGLAKLASTGFVGLGKTEIGPIGSLYSFNSVEGDRFRLGLRAAPELSNRFFWESYAAYGLKDERWKYLIGTTISLNDKKVFRFPQHYLKASFQRDVKIPGQESLLFSDNSAFSSFTSGDNDRFLYNDIWRLDYLHEFENHFSYALGFKNWRQKPAGSLTYINDRGTVPELSTSEIMLEMRWAPGEKFYQGRKSRMILSGKYPVFNMQFIAGLKGVFGAEYDYQKVVTNIRKRFFLSPLGYADISLSGGYLFGRVPYPLLTIHSANQTYFFQENSYNMMNFIEFVSDHYASFSIDHSFNGLLLNKIPLLKKLKLRESAGFKLLYGNLRNENDPALNPFLYKFPVNENGVPLSYTLNNGPYSEANIGVGNILKFLTVHWLYRFNYLDNPSVDRTGVKVSIKFDF